MVGAGYREIMTYSFLGADRIEALGLASDDVRRAPVAVRNPLSEEEGCLRTTLLPAVLGALRANASRGRSDAAVFEMGRVFLPGDGDLPEQPQRLAFAAAGRAPGPLWEGSVRALDAFDAIGVWETLGTALGVEAVLEQAAEAPFHPGRCGRVTAGGRVIGTVGEIHPAVAEAFGIEGSVAAGEIDLDHLMAPVTAWGFVVPSAHPPIVFDLAFDLPEETAAASLVAEVRAAAGDLLERIQIFDVFSGPPLEEGRKSIAVRLTLRHAGRTLTDDEVAPIRESVAEAVARRLDGRLRGG
jgi:phenylalanyl-tRNA synthetase beta chain